MASKHTEQLSTDETRIDRDRAQGSAVSTDEELRLLPRPPAAPRLSPALSVTLNAALDRLLEVLGVDAGAVRMIEEATRALLMVAHRAAPPQLAQAVHRRNVGQGLSSPVLPPEAPIVVEHISQHPTLSTLSKSLLRQEGYESCMVVPLRLHGQLVGTLSLFACSARGFDSYERSFFDQVGVTLENVLLYEEAAHREREAAFLVRATRLFTRPLGLALFSQQVTRLATEVLGDGCSIALAETGNAYLIPGPAIILIHGSKRSVCESNGRVPSASAIRGM